MSTTNPAVRYSRGAIILHWLIAILIIGNFVGAWVSEDLPRDQEVVVMGYHKATGVVILLLTLVRIGWRLFNKPPALVDTLKSWEVALAKVTHALFYALMLIVPLAGLGLHSAFGKGKPVSLFGLVDFPALPVGSDKPTIGLFHDLHEVTATAMLVLLGIHVLAALKHQFLDRDGTLARMSPFGR
ncbi:MAG: hypothetical protein RLZZ415_453 [Pseudomonadota bacterium]|jgi:cytochrome b561